MSYLIPPFEVSSQAMSGPVQVRFIHLLAAIATRHSDTIDCLFRVGGQQVTVAVSCAALAQLRERDHVHLSDQQVAEIAARFLHRTLEQGYDATQAELLVGGKQLGEIARELGYL